MHSIKRLPKSVHSTVRSSIVLFDMARVVEELIYNCIDAGSSKVDISINVRACYVKVADDGCGITRDGLVILGEKYATSKINNEIECGTSNMGFKGETLGSLSDISLVEIRTKARGWPNAYCKILKGSKCIFLGIDDQRETVGTTVTIRDLFYNQPVRRKCMQSSPKKVLHSVKACALQIALVHPQVSFRVTDTESEDELFCTVPSSSPLPLVSNSYGLEISSCLHQILYPHELYTLSGFISGPCDTSTKALQYLYVNSKFVTKGVIHNMVNNLATRFYTDQIRDEYSKSQSRKRQKCEGYPAFLLNLCCPLSKYELSFEPSKTVVEFKDLNIVLSFFERAVTKFWKGLPRDPLNESCRVEDSSLSLERHGLNLEGENSLASIRKRKNKTTLCQSPTLMNIEEEINDDILFKTPPRGSRTSTSKDFNFVTINTRNCDWLDDGEYLSKKSPIVGRNYENTNLIFEDKPIMDSFMENEYPKREYFSDYDGGYNYSADFENIGGVFCNFEDYCSKVNMYFHESCLEGWGDMGKRRKEKYNTWNFPEASRSDFGSPDRGVFNSPCSFSTKLHDFGFGDEIFESGEHMNIFAEIKKVDFRERKFFEYNRSDPFLDSPIAKRNSEFSLFYSPGVKKSNGLGFESPLDKSKLQKHPSDQSKLQNCPLDHTCNVRRRSHSAPPFHKGKRKFSALNERLTGQNPSFHVTKTSPVAAKMHLSQPCCKPTLAETSELNFREKSNVETGHQDQHDKFDYTENELTKWRADRIQPTVVDLDNNSTEDILNISSGILHLSSNNNSLIPQSIERDCFQDARVLLQVDKKFIPVIAKDILIMLDQHAADERIRLEDLRRKVLSGEGCRVTHLDSEEELVLPEIGFQLLEKYSEQIKKWGWITSNNTKSSDPFIKNMSDLKKHVSVITLVAVPCILGTNLTSKDLIELLEQLVETDGSVSLPPSVIRILNSKACRGAIMFGDPLLPSECSLILEELKETSLFFQCAHGRPTTVPILNIKELHEELAKIEIQNDTWHGLKQHKHSLERTKMRLNQAKM